MPGRHLENRSCYWAVEQNLDVKTTILEGGVLKRNAKTRALVHNTGSQRTEQSGKDMFSLDKESQCGEKNDGIKERKTLSHHLL